ncbi:hypothetical protein N665_0025s0302 [Sinapis alba]|nr:hypothetical protein N665_0025s0302 [Sinapis alba]
MTDPVLPAAPETASGNDPASAVKPIAPGFRFHPTDEELITYYLKRKVQGKPIRFDTIAEVNVYKHEPSELPEHSKLKTKDQEWFFFCALEKKYNNRTVINRATKKGYWKKTGEDKIIKRGGDDKVIGVVKILVFRRGRGPKGNRTNWVIHEYHLVVNQLEIGSYVLCKVFRKEHAGPSAGCIYAPFSEQDWDDCDDGDGGINEKIQQENHLESQTTQEQCENEREPVATVVPTSSSTELINHLEKEKQKMAAERETYQLDLMRAEMMLSFLQGKIDALRAENEELKKTNSNKE